MTDHSYARPGLAVALPLLLGSTTARALQPTLPELDRFASQLTRRAEPLAMSVVVVRGDSVVHLAGYGLRDRARALPVTPRTAFYIASSTKSFTALTAALLAERRVVDLDAPITRYAPEFRLPPPLDVSRITLRRLLSHRAGFESDPLSFRTAYTGDLAADSLFAIVARTAQPVDTSFTYTNTAFIVAARALERATGTQWQDLIAREVLQPLGMRQTTARASATGDWEVAQGYGPGPHGYHPVAPKPDAMMHAAGGMVMSAADAALWLRAQLNQGRVGRRQILPPNVVAGTHRLLATQTNRYENIDRLGYALGWQIGLLDGDTLYHHFGNYPGAFAHVSFMPARRIGVAVFVNAELPEFRQAGNKVAARAYDLVLGRTERNREYAAYVESLGGRVARMYDGFRSDFARRSARPRRPPRGWSAYAGSYVHPDMGRLSIVALGDSSAEVRYGAARSRLEVFQGDDLRVEMPPGRSGSPARVVIGAGGAVESITIAGTRFERVR